METEPVHKTAKDAFIYDLMGDVGRLHDLIKALPEGLEKATAPALGAIAMAVKDAKASAEQVGKAEKATFGNFAAAEKSALRDSLRVTLREEAGDALASAARELATSARIHQEAVKGEITRRGQWIAVALIVGLMAGALGVYGSHLLYGKQAAEQAAYGRAVSEVWGTLDAKTKERIQAAITNQQK